MKKQNVSLDKSTIKVLLLEGIDVGAKEAFRDAGFNNIECLNHALDEAALIKELKTVRLLGIRSRTQLSRRVIEACPHLVAVGCFCIGTNQVALDAAQLAGVPVFNAPFSNTRSVAELVIGQMILLYRNVIDKNAKMHKGQWLKSASQCHEVRGKTLGIIGYGHIGSQVSILAESLGMSVLFYDIEHKLPLGNAKGVKALSALLKKADIVTLHVPEDATTQNMIDTAALSLMKKGSVLINASRGKVVDIDALSDALNRGHIKGAAVDVFPVEPGSNDEPFVSPLMAFDNVFLTPHIGGSTHEAQKNIAVEVADKMIKYCDNGSTLSAVNFPELALPMQKNVHRILHIHENKPGVMRAINRAFFDREINIEGQYLRTMGDIGYVVIDIDIDHEASKELLDQLKQIDGTIRARVLF
ncbi:MAG: phosphoglycerate dehydrogenase [Francisellaceae bacterium]